MRRVLAGAIALAAACAEDRASETAAPTWRDDVGRELAARCAPCHAGAEAKADWRATSYLEAIGCVGGLSVVAPGDEHAPIVRALDADVHAAVRDDRPLLASWASAGAPAFRGAVHAAGIVDPRSPDFHGALLRGRKWTPMNDPNDADACGRCHDGAARPPGVTISAPGATACTDCHRDEGGVNACTTCHGPRGYPPRDRCFFPNDRAGAHETHMARSLACATCHPTGDARHGDGVVETTGTCGSCHDRGGARPDPSWDDTRKMTCNDCHKSPPANHHPGACASCHPDASSDRHANGRVDLGDGSGKCGACHGRGDDPWPTTASHPAHRDPKTTTPIACASCHPVPASIDAPGHMDGVVQIAFSGRAVARGARPSWDGTSCSDVACHGAKLAEPIAPPAWRGGTVACGSCHGVPPSKNHTAATDCERSTCHGSEVVRGLGGPSIGAGGLSVHIDGVVETAP